MKIKSNFTEIPKEPRKGSGHIGLNQGNYDTKWSDDQIKTLTDLIKNNVCTPCIATKLGRTETAVRQKASELKISLNPNDLKGCVTC